MLRPFPRGPLRESLGGRNPRVGGRNSLEALRRRQLCRAETIDRDDRSLGELFSELTQETRTLVRQEVDLAKSEMSQKASRLGKDIGFLAAGGLWLMRGSWQ